MTINELISGLKIRGFVGTDGIDSMSKCHKGEDHYILLTDGLVIYSNVPFYKNAKYIPNSLVESWTLERFDEEDKSKEFSFDELDTIIAI